MKKKLAVLCCGWSYNFVLDFVAGMRRATKENDTDIYLFNCYNFVEFSGYPNNIGFSIYNLIHYEDFDGIIVLSDLILNPRILERERQRILNSGKPSVSINLPLRDMNCLRVDNYSGTYELITHLIKNHNLHKFAYLGAQDNSVTAAERYKAYRTALQDNRIPIDMNRVFSIKNANYNEAYNFISNYFSEKKELPEVFVCSNDFLAMAILKACKDYGIKVPEQLKLVGADDISFSSCVYPGLSSVKNNSELLGFEAASRVMGMTGTPQVLKFKTNPVYRYSCACQENVSIEKKSCNLEILNDLYQKESFTDQISLIEEIFTEASDVFTLLTSLEQLFKKSHTFEGSDFCIFLKSDWTSVLINSEETLPQNLSYGTQVQSITSIHNNEKHPNEIINTRDLIPEKMKTDECNLYIFLPIFNHSYVHGYYVCKNSTLMLNYNYAYVWTNTFGKAIERFRQKNMFKLMSQQFLKLSTTDALSGMMNRVGLEKIAKPFYAQNKKNGITSVLFFVDINSMKTINDKFGHLHGDLAVKTIASAIMEVMPKGWMCIRYGGDEFLIVGSSKNYNGEDYCSLITKALEKKTAIMKLPYNLSASTGSYLVPPNSELSLEQAVEKVDEIMYKAKQEYHKTH